MIIPVFPLWEPWASAIAYGYKTWETRDHKTNVRGLCAIYATKIFPEEAEEFAKEMVAAQYFDSLDELQHGKIVCIAELTKDVPTTDVRLKLNPRERKLGNYEHGRRAYKLERVRRLVVPYPTRGHQGQWKMELPDDVVASAIAVEYKN